MAKKYLSNQTRTSHTYEFYKDRQDNPKWRDDFLNVRAIRRRNIIIQSFFGLIILGILVIFGLYFMAGKNTAKNMQTQSDSTLSSKTSGESADSVVDDTAINTTESDSSDENDIPISDAKDTNEYQATTELGPYSVSTEDMNAIKIYSWKLGAVNKQERFSLKLNNETGAGILFEYDDNDIKRAEVKIHYQEIKTKRIIVTDRVVKVNTILLVKGDSPRYVFKNKSGGVSIVKVVTDQDIPDPFYVEAKAE